LKLNGISRKFEFWQQLVIILIVGITILAIATSVAISFINNSSVKSQIVQQASYLTELIAKQSRLSLLYQSTTSARETAEVALQFPDVVGIAIANEDDKILYEDGVSLPVGTFTIRGSRALLHHEDDNYLVFIAPVVTEPMDSSIWDVEAEDAEAMSEAQQIGSVKLVFSKSSLKTIQSDILRGNVIVSFLGALLLLGIVIFLARRMTSPLNELSLVMRRAQQGEMNLRASPSGPKDIVSMQESFNTMMAAIEQRDNELRHARDLALRTAEVKSQFAANVSHELRTPMNSVLGMLDLLTYMGLSGKQLEYVETAKFSAQNLLDLIDDILSYVHADSGEIVLDERETDLVALVEEVLNLLSAQALRKKLDLGYTIAPGLGHARIDAQRVKQILTNLVGNAIKFTDSGEVAIAISLLPASPGQGSSLMFRVKDTGVGIKPENQRKIFDAFTQEDTTTTRKYGGTGLGLAICKQYVALMKGEISVTSERYQGSEFWFTVPLKSPYSVQDDGNDPAALDRVHALVADDSTVVRDFFEQWILARHGAVDTVADVNSLLALINRGDQKGTRYTHLFIDEHLSGVLLADLLRLVKNHEATRDVVVCVLVNPWAAESLVGISDCFFIEKPLTDLKLSNLLVADNVHGFRSRRPPSIQVFSSQLNKKVLVVDDNRANRLVASAMLEQFGCDCDYAQNGQDAVDRISRKSFDMVLMDCNMPVMDGYDATRAIRKLPNVIATLPIIGMTANNSPEERQRCTDAGMDDLLVKPLTVEGMNQLLRGLFAAEGGNVVRHKAARSFDQRTLDLLKESVGEVFITVVDAFIDDLPMYLLSLRSAISKNDAQQVYELAHTIKGTGASVGAEVVASLSRKLEDMGKARDLRGAEAFFNELESAAIKVTADLKNYLRAIEAENYRYQSAEAQSVILVADDDRSMRMLFANALRSDGFRILEAGNGQSVLALCARAMPDIILIDAIMPELDGFEACKKIRQLHDGADVPILMVTSLEDEQSIAHAFSVGATDYITKPVNFSVLRQRVNRLLQTSRIERHVRQLAYHDALTGLPNRAYFNQQLRHKISRASLNNKQLAVLFLDLDRFKMINDSLGHDAGDLVLKAAAERISRCVRKSDFVARLGGDEFTVVFEDIETPEIAAEISKKICDALRAPFVFLHQRMFISASIGIAVYPSDGIDMNTLLKHADTAMFKAKEAGQDYCFYQPGMEDEVTEKLQTERDLRLSIERDEITFFYQPQVLLATGEVIGFESLVRWRHPDKGLMTAANFIEVAEESGLVGDFARLAFDQGASLLRDWHGRELDLRLAINISGGEFQNGQLRQQISDLLERFAIPPAMLEIEITESMLMEQPELAQSEISALRRQGLSIAIDDFGSGFSSLNYLKRFAVDVLKIDRAFVRDCHLDKNDQAIITGIVTLAKSLNLQVVAEGVELVEQADFLRSVGCDMAQGYLFGTPVSAEEIEEGIRSGALAVRPAVRG
jgi:diguanylate cyclase (GGDEF)-like protein